MNKTSILIIAFLALAGCVPVQQTAEPARTATAECIYPLITALPETRALQTKGKINISLAPNTFECVSGYEDVAREVRPGFADQLAFSMNNPDIPMSRAKFVEVTKMPTYTLNPDKISFRVKINNQMPRVFRGAGTVVLYNFGGNNTSISSQDYAELTNVIVPPRTETEVVIYGPAITSVPDNTTFGIFLYDVVIATDNAGNVTEKQNFEWYYNYQTEVRQETREVTSESNWVAR